MKEKEIAEWRDIQGYEGSYQVNQLGEVRSLDRIVGVKNKYRKKGTVMSLRKNCWGYLDVLFRKNGKEKRHLVHRLVAKAFIPLVKGKDLVHHIDGNKANNNVWNLEWVSKSENTQYAVKDGLFPKNKPYNIPLIITKNGIQKRCNSFVEAGKFIGRSSEALRLALRKDWNCAGWKVKLAS